MDFENRFGLGMPNFDNLNRMCARAGLADSTAIFSYFLCVHVFCVFWVKNGRFLHFRRLNASGPIPTSLLTKK